MINMISQVLEKNLRLCAVRHRENLIHGESRPYIILLRFDKQTISRGQYHLPWEAGRAELLLLSSLGAVLRTALLAVSNALSVQRTADNVVTYTGKVLYTTAADENN